MKSFCMNASVSTKHHGEFWGEMKPLLPNTRGKSQNKIILVDSERVVTHPLSVKLLVVKGIVLKWKISKTTLV